MLETFVPGVLWTAHIAARLAGTYEQPDPPIDMKLMFRDKAAARSSFEKVLSWDFDRLILAHGHLIQSDAKTIFRQAYRFVLKT